MKSKFLIAPPKHGKVNVTYNPPLVQYFKNKRPVVISVFPYSSQTLFIQVTKSLWLVYIVKIWAHLFPFLTFHYTSNNDDGTITATKTLLQTTHKKTKNLHLFLRSINFPRHFRHTHGLYTKTYETASRVKSPETRTYFFYIPLLWFPLTLFFWSFLLSYKYDIIQVYEPLPHLNSGKSMRNCHKGVFWKSFYIYLNNFHAMDHFIVLYSLLYSQLGKKRLEKSVKWFNKTKKS